MGANQTLFKGSLLQKHPLMCIISMKQYCMTNWNIYIEMKFTFVQNFVYIMIICKRELKFIQKRGHTPCEGKVHRCLFEIFSWPEVMGHSIKLSTKHPWWKGTETFPWGDNDNEEHAFMTMQEGVCQFYALWGLPKVHSSKLGAILFSNTGRLSQGSK